MQISKKQILVAGGTLALSLALITSAFAAGTTSTSLSTSLAHRGWSKNAVHGTVSSISGDSITLAGSNGTTYTIDATSAKVSKFAAGSKPASITVSQIADGDTLTVMGTISGSSVTAKNILDGMMPARKPFSGVIGKVSAVSGSTITVTSTNPKTKAVTTYTVDASSATVTKSGAASSVSNIAVGDTIVAQGTVSGTSVAATKINDGIGGKRGGAGHGARGVFGTVASISGNTITVTSTNPKTKAVTTYTVDATSAKIMKGAQGSAPASITVSQIAVGDTVAVGGTVSGTSITAKTIFDGKFAFGQRGGHGGKKNSTSQTATTAAANS